MRKLIIATVAAVALAVAPAASAQQYSAYISCGYQGAYLYSWDMTWTGSHWIVYNEERQVLWGRC